VIGSRARPSGVGFGFGDGQSLLWMLWGVGVDVTAGAHERQRAAGLRDGGAAANVCCMWVAALAVLAVVGEPPALLDADDAGVHRAAAPPRRGSADKRRPAEAPERARLVILDVSSTDASVPSPTRAALHDALVAAAFAFDTVQVSSLPELRAAMKLEADRQQTGCDTATAEGTSCAAELADAYGARYVLFSTLGRLGAQWSLALSLFDSRNAQVVGRATVRAGTLPQLTTLLTGAVDEAMATLGAPRRAPVAEGAAPVAAPPLAPSATLDIDDVALADEPLLPIDAAPCAYDPSVDQWGCGGSDGVAVVTRARSGAASTAGAVRVTPDVSRGCPSTLQVELGALDDELLVDWSAASAQQNGSAVPLKATSGLTAPVVIAPRTRATERFLPAGGCLGPGDIAAGDSDVVALSVSFFVVRGAERIPARATWVRRRWRAPVEEPQLLALVPEPTVPTPPPDLVSADEPGLSFSLAGGGVGAACAGAGGVAAWFAMPASSSLAERALVSSGYVGACGVCVAAPLLIGGAVGDAANHARWQSQREASEAHRLAERRYAAWLRQRASPGRPAVTGARESQRR
jgi:hypothetical protein